MLSGAVLGQSQERAGLVLGQILGLVFPALAAPSFSVCLDSFFPLWRESVSSSVVLITVNLPLAQVLVWVCFANMALSNGGVLVEC